MDFSKLKSNYQRSLRSMFSLTKENTLTSNQKQVLISSLNNFIKYLEYFIFNWKLFFFSIKKNYLFQLITFKEISNCFVHNNILLFFQKLKNSRSTIVLFFNIPFFISITISEIFESIIKKTIYLYRIFLLLSIPVLIFCVNQTFVSQNKKDYLSFLLPQKNFFSQQDRRDEKNSFYIKNLRKTILRYQILNFLSKKIKSFVSPNQDFFCLFEEKISYLSYLSNYYEQKPLWTPLPLRVPKEGKFNKFYLSNKFLLLNPLGAYNHIQTPDETTKYTNQKTVIFSKCFSLYIKLKKIYLINFSFCSSLPLRVSGKVHRTEGGQNNCSIKEKNLNKNWIAKSNYNFNSLRFFQFVRFLPLDPLRAKKNNFLKQEFLQKFDSSFFSLIQPKDLKNLTNLPLKILSNRHSFILDFFKLKNADDPYGKRMNKKSIYLEKNTNRSQQKKIKKNENILQSVNKQQWMLTIRQWIKLYPYQDKFNCFSQNKQKVKKNFQLFQNVKFLINFLNLCFARWTPVGQIYFGNSLLNRVNLSSLFVNSQQTFVSRSYKNALQLPLKSLEEKKSNFDNSLFVLRNKSYHLEYFPLSIKITNNKKLFQKINFLYRFSFYNNDYIFINPEAFFLIQNTTKMPFRLPEGRKKNFQSVLIENSYGPGEKNLYDLDFYLQNYKTNDDLFWIPSSSLQKKMLEQKEKKQNKKDSLSSSVQISRFNSFQEDFKLIKKKRDKLQNSIISSKFKIFKQYNKWIFTTQWWIFHKQGILTEIKSFVEDLTNITQILLQHLATKFGYTNKKYLLSAQKLKIIPNIFVLQFQGWKKLFVERIYTSQQEKPLWINLKLLTSVNNSSWSFFAWFIANSIIYYHWVPMLTGTIYLFLWLDFEKIRSFSYPSWKTFLSILNHNSFSSPSQQLRLVGYLSRGRMFSMYSKVYRLYSNLFFIFNRFHYITTLDLSRRNKNLVSTSFITKKTLQSKHYFWNTSKENADGLGDKNGAKNGFNFFQKWYEKNCRISSLLQKIVVKSFSLNWLSDLFFYNKNLIYGLTCKSNIISINGNSKPISLSEPLTYTQRWLFIGSLESGKSFAIKNIAASTHCPLIHISIKDIKNATPDNKYNKIIKQKRWVEQLSERSFFLDNIFNLAKIVSPSILWISDLHDFDTKNQIQEKNTQKFDISLLVATLLKILSIDLVPEGQNHITFIGSTEYPRLLDPKFVSRQRLDLIVNFRTPSFNQRQSIFTSLLKTKGFTIKGLRSFYELTSNTLGYTFRDIKSLVNETLLVKTTENTTLINSNTIRLALYRQTSTQSVKYKTIRQENLQYKIGKALVQTILVYPKSIILLSKYYDLWKTKFYYLSNTYLEVSSKKAIITEFVLLTQILNCLAGSAARDAWILSTKGLLGPRGEKILLSLTSQLKHDFSIASNILQSLLVEFSMRDMTCLNPKKKKNLEEILKTFHFNFLKRAMSYLEFLDQFPSYINWSIKGKRLSFNWILFFNGIEHSTKNLARLLFLDKSKKNIFSPIFSKNSDINIPYERRETKRQQQKIQKIDSFFNKLVYTVYMENLGFPWESNYVMDYNPFQFSLFFREARPLWNPQTIMPSYSILFFNRDLLINQKMLTKLYITYGYKFKIEKLNRKRIKKQNFWSNSSFNKIDVNIISEIKKDSGNDQILSYGTHWSDFHIYQNMINLNAQLDQSQIQLPVYLHQGWTTVDPNETFRAFDILSTKILVNNDHLIYKESFLFEILLEIYHYLLKFFLKNKNIMIQTKEILLKNEILYRQDIEFVIKKFL